MATMWAWIGVASFAAGGLALVLTEIGGSGRNRHHFVVSLVVILLALGAYLALAVHQDASGTRQAGQLGYGRHVEWAQWALTTPLLLMGLVMLALPRVGKQPLLVAGILLSDLFMITTGILAGLSEAGSGAEWAWYFVSCGAFAALNVQIWGPLRSAAIGKRYRGEGLRASGDPDERRRGASFKGETSLFYRQAGLLSVLWLIYPIVFLVSPRALDLLPPSYAVAFYTVLDVSSRAGFGLLLLTGVKTIERDACRAFEEAGRGQGPGGKGSGGTGPGGRRTRWTR